MTITVETIFQGLVILGAFFVVKDLWTDTLTNFDKVLLTIGMAAIVIGMFE